MFHKADAGRLRDSLPPIGFTGEATDLPLLQAWRSHYGLPGHGEGSAVSHQAGVFDSGEHRLVCHSFTPRDSSGTARRGTAFLVHGYYDHSGLYGHLIRHCLQLGLGVVIFDLPGHGLSSGAEASIDSFAEYCQALTDCLQLAREAALPRPWHGIGQSTGGAVLIDSLLHHDLQARFDLQHHVLLAPLLRPVQWQQSMLLFALTRWFISASPRRFSTNSHDEEFLRFLRERDELQCGVLPRQWILALRDYLQRFRRAPVCDAALRIVQGSEDGTVDWQWNLARLAEKFPASRAIMIDGARHHLVNESVDYRERLFGLLTDLLLAEEGPSAPRTAPGSE